MTELKKTILIAAICVSCTNYAMAQAWVQKKGNSYSQIGFSTIAGESKYNNSGDPLDLARKVSDITLQLYHEQGITDKLTVIGNVPIKFVSTGDKVVSEGFSGNTLPAGKLTGLGNISLSVVYGIKQNPSLVYSVQLRTDLNTASEDQTTGLRTGVDAWGIAPSFHVGYGGNSFWTSFNIGTNLRTNNYSTQWFSNYQIGTKLGRNFDIIGQFEVLQSFEDGNAPDGNAIETGLYTNNLEFAAINLKLGYSLKEEITFWGAIGGGVSGNDVLRAPAFSLSISYKM